jgi:C-terminal processing protease CtpA/Prc
MDSFKDTKALIIDLRSYWHDDSLLNNLSSYFMPQPVDYTFLSQVKSTQPGTFLRIPANKTGHINTDYYKGKIIILVNEATCDNAEMVAMALQASPNGLTIGSTATWSFLHTSLIVLPGNIQACVKAAGIYYPDGHSTYHQGLKIDREVRPTIQGIQEGRDELIEKAIEIIQGSK